MAKLFNLARMTTATTGTGTITLGSAVSGFLTFAQAGVSDGDIVYYGISDGVNSEVGLGTYTSAGTTLARTTVTNSTNSNNAISLSGTAEVFITALAASFGMDRIATSSPSGVATITFSSIPAGYSALKIICHGRSDNAGSGTTDGVKMRFNGDTGNNYAYQTQHGNISSSGANQVTATSAIQIAEFPRAGNIASYPGSCEIIIPFYDKTTFNKTALSHFLTFNNTGITSLFDLNTSGVWASTAAITSITLFTNSTSNFTTGTEFRLHGIF